VVDLVAEDGGKFRVAADQFVQAPGDQHITAGRGETR
jgi:hypothetical protein